MGPETGLKNVSDQNNTLCMTVANSARRLDVLRSCIASIFENRISDAKKTFPSVMSTLKTKLARLVLVEELASRKGSFGSTQVLLEHQQFDMVIRLMNAALQDDSDMDIHGIAAALLPLSTVFGRKLSKGVTQFAYTLIQDHAVWQNQAFWEASFFNDVQIGIKTLYQAMHDQNSNATRLNEPSPSQRTSVTSIQSNQASNKRASVSAGPKMGHYVPDNQVVLELAAEEIRGWERLDEAAKAERVSAEEATVYSQALIYINNMISMLCPLELAGSPKRNKRYEDYENASNSISNSMAESDSIDRESGFEEQEIPSNAQQVIKNVLRFADKIGSESSMTTDHMRTIEPMIRTSVTMHVDNLEEVSRQAKRLPPIQKPKINFPSLLPGEELVVSRGLRVYLLPDGREDGNNNEASQTQNAATVVSGGVGGVKLLPAEGALFLTTYRLIFKGNPIDPFAAESIVTRFFPVSSLTREKRFTLNEYLTEIEQQLKEGIQLRSSTFQLIRAAFDDEVTMEDVEMFRKSIQSVQFPEHLFQSFAFRGNHNLYLQEPLSKGKEKHAKYSSTIRGFASKTLKNVTKVTGYNSKSKRKLPNKYFLPNMMPTQGRLSIAEMTNPDGRTIREEDESEAAGGEMGLYPFSLSSSSSAKVTEQRLMERSNFKDWVRVGLLPPEYNVSGISGGSSKSQHNHSETFRTTTINHRYGLCSTYPALLLVPSRVSDDSLQRYSRCHRQSRFPTITWKHPGNHALLVRGAGFHSKGVMGMIRRHQDSSSSSATGHSSVPGSQGEVTVASSVETDLYVNAVIHATPRAMVRPDSSRNMSGSQLSINSLMYGGNSGNSGTLPGGTVSNNDHYSGSQNYPTLTPNMGRKMNPLTKAMDTLTRNSGPPKFGRMTLSNLKGNKTLGSQSSLTSSGAYRGSYRYSESRAEGTLTAEGVARQPELIGGFLQKTALYIFGDKNQIKGAKLESHSKTEFIPIDYPEPRKIRASFKKLMRACVPSGPTNQPEQTFLKQVESSEWLVYLQTLLQISGAVVDLIDSQGASVMVCLEEGWDATCQISSLSMLCLDPFYRTIDGFRVLIEKEWLSAGHRFSHRNNLASNNQDHGFTPVFLQFLDGVHQLLTQFPTAFEFNHFYLKFLAYHHVSCRFRTFLLDCDALRSEIGLFAVDSKRGSFPKTSGGVVTGSDVGNNAQNHSSDEENGGTIYPGGALGGKGNSRNGGTTTLPGSNHVGVDVFDYIESHSSKSPVFFNFLYAAGEFSSDVLRPCSHISNLKIWSYFTGEELKHGASYDLELFTLDQMQEEEYPNNSNDTMSVADGTQNSSAVGYDCSLRTMTDSCSVLLEEIAQLESELGYLPTKWKQIWESLTAPPRLDLGNDRGIGPGVALTTPSSTARNHCRQMHKRSTMELILKGKIGSHAISSSSSSSHPSARASVGVTDYGNSHPFEKHNFPAPSTCEVCGGILWGPVVYGLRCQDCGYSCHEKCRDSVTKICSSKHCSAAGSGLPRDASTDYFGGAAFDQLRQGGDDRGSESQAERRRSQQQHSEDGHHHLYSQFSPGFSSEESNSQIICQGYLNKQANFKIKGWKQRWFVLDATKHQLRYYDTREDFQCKGDIDLSEVNKIVEGYSTPGAPKKAEDGCFFDLVTAKRTFCFCAEGKAAAQDWITKIQSCLST